MENTSILKYTLLLLAAPIWWPVVKAMWIEVNRMLAEDGGVLGRHPSATQREELRREKEDLGDPLISEPIHSEQQRAAGRRALADRGPAGASPARKSGQSPNRLGGPGPPARKSGFR